MSIKDLFDKNQEATQILTSDSIKNISQDAESEKFVEEKIKDKERFIPQFDFDDPTNFARFGLAEEYYEQALKRIYDTFPYDGSRNEVQQWFNSSSFFDKYIFDNEYPRTTGYAIFGDSGEDGAWGEQIEDGDGFTDLPEESTAINYGYGAPATASYEYIFIKGGPNKDPDNEKLRNMFPSNDGKSNLFDVDNNRECNLKIGGGDGNTVEFWMKKAAFDTSGKTQKEVILDVWSTSSMSSSADYARFTVELDGNPASSPFLVTYMSGTEGVATASVGDSGVTTSTVADDKWHHNGVSVANFNDTLSIKLYVDGEYNGESLTGSIVGYVSSSLVATIGALVTKPSASISPEGPMTDDYWDSLQPNRGWGKLSASLDEFRYWKTERTVQQIGRNWYTNVYGGTNTDVVNAQLGVYFKFNEGITGTSSVDNVVLDYSGRNSNGLWTGYSSNSRSTSSAIVESSASAAEFKDPIIRSGHPDVQDKINALKKKGKEHDLNNNSSIYYSVPEWIISEDQVSGKNLVKLTQIISNYFDTLSLQIKALPSLKAPTYPSSSHKSIPFADQLLESHGLIVPELFTDSTILQQFAQQDETRNFNKDLREVKNLIYKNIYNNLSYIYKSKGTEKSFRNLIRCFGIDDEIIKVNIYGDNAVYKIKDNYRHTITKKNYVDFNSYNTNNAVVYQYLDDDNENTVSFVTSSVEVLSGSARTLEAEVIFPKPINQKLTNYTYNVTASSLFGFHTAGSQEDVVTWPSPDHDLRVLAIRDQNKSNSAYFKLESGFLGAFEDGLHFLTSSVYENVYNDEKWNFAVRIKRGVSNRLQRDLYPLSPGVSGSFTPENDSDLSGSIEFYGVNVSQNYVKNEFIVSSSITLQKYKNMIESTKRIYAGAHRTNFTGDVIESSDAKVSSIRYWLNDLSNKVIKTHAYDVENFGTEHPYRNAYLFEGPPMYSGSFTTGSLEIPNMETLALHWDFANITGSDGSGEFVVTDVSSGSLNSGSAVHARHTGDLMVKTFRRQHSGVGKFFPASNLKVVDRIYLSNAKQQIPEVIASSNMIEARTFDDRWLTRDSRPITHFIGIEKSPYQSVSEEMLKVFATLTDFNNLIGAPVNVYRHNYKQMEKLRQLFFERVGNIPDVEKYIEYYKWIDNAVDAIIHQLMPASANTSKSLSTIIESHVLERNKFRHKYPMMSNVMANADIEGTVGVSEHKDSCIQTPRADVDLISKTVPGDELDINDHKPAKFKQRKFSTLLSVFKNTTSPEQDNLDTTRSTNWWRKSAERDKTDEISSGNSTVDSQRETIRKIVGNIRVATVQELKEDHIHVQNHQPMDIPSIFSFAGFEIKGGSNSEPKSPYAKTILKPFSSDSRLIITASDSNASAPYGFQTLTEFNDEYVPGISSGKRLKLNFRVQNVGDEKLLLSMHVPFNVYTSSEGREITNIHDDSSINGITSMQGPFTEQHVGGLQYRHVPLNISGTLDTDKTRPEGFKIHATGVPSSYGNGSEDNKKVIKNAGNGALINYTTPDMNYSLQLDSDLPRAMFYREEMAKRPVNIRNIKSGSYNGIGNYSKDYEIVQTMGRTENNFYHIDISGAVSSSVTASDFPDLQDFTLPDRTKYESVFVNRFSAPGGPEVMSRGFLDTVAEEYSVYNALPWRNSTVRRARNTLLRNRATKDSKYDSTYVDPAGVYDSSGSYHKTNPNVRYILSWSAGPGSTVVTGAIRDNGFVTHQIPQSDLQYAWITASAYEVSGGLTINENIPFGYSKPNQKYGGASNDITFLRHSEAIINYYLHVDFVGLNYTYVDDIDTDNNLIFPAGGTGDNNRLNVFSIEQIELSVDGTYPVPDIASVNVSRNGPYGWPSWKQIRTGNHLISRYHKKNNIYSFFANVDKDLNPVSGTAAYKDVKQLIHHKIPPVTTKYKPLEKTFYDDSGEINVSYTHGNLKTSMLIGEGELDKEQFDITVEYKTEDELTDLVEKNIISLKDITYREIVFPRAEYTTFAKSNRRMAYDEVRHTGSNGFDRLHGSHRTFWRSRINDRMRTNQYATNSMGHGLASFTYTAEGGVSDSGGPYFSGDWIHPLRPLALSAWPLDSFHGGYMSGGFSRHDAQISNRSNFGATGELYAQSEGAFVSSSDAERSTGDGISQCFFFYQHYGWLGTTDTQTWPDDYYIKTPDKWKPDFPESDSNLQYLYHFKPQYSASAISGLTPWYDSYEDYALNLTSLVQDFSILPEFKISDHMEYYLKNGFLAKNNKFLSLPGAATKTNKDLHILDIETESVDFDNGNVEHYLSSSAASEAGAVSDDFYKIYSHSDFLDSFELIKSNNPDKKVSEITLKCRGAKKLLPYQGFYPVLRCVQLGSMLSQSFGHYLTATVGSSMHDIRAQALIQPFFAPGIMYNTIKSGIAVDWPIITGSTKIGDAASNFGYMGYLTTGSSLDTKQYHNRRFPFESLLHPERYIPAAPSPGAEQGSEKGTIVEARVNMVVSPSYRSGSQTDAVNIYDFETNAPHYIWTGQHDKKYNFAMHNFIGEIPRFFLKDERLTTFASKRGPFTMVSGTTYYMDVVLEKTPDFVMYEGPHIEMSETNPESGLRYSSGSARGLHYGPACDTLGAEELDSHTIVQNGGTDNSIYNWLSNIQDPAFAPYTPPYFYGESVARIAFSPHKHRELLDNEGPQEFTIDEILEGAKIETIYEPNRTASYAQATNLTKNSSDTTDLEGYIRVPDELSMAGVGKMKIDSSINLFGKTKVKEVTYEVESALEGKYKPILAKDSADSSFDIWTISSKFETPTLNFSGNAKGHFTRGMWFGYGETPQENQGIFLRLRESFPEKVGQSTAMTHRSADPFIEQGNSDLETSKTGSLIDACGFVQSGTDTKRRIGEIAEQKVISEAVIAIPFKAKTKSSKKRYFDIPKDYINIEIGRASKKVIQKYEKKGIKIGDSVKDMIEKMQKYVIPPHHDFVTNKNIDPFVMYIFEFEHVLDKEDLSNIWQNLMPKIAITPEMGEAEITHPCGVAGEFFENGEIPQDIKWMVYKVKKKAETNYFNITSDSQDDDRFKFEFNIESEKATADYSYNWPYDFFSLVELANLEVGITLLEDSSKEDKGKAKPSSGTTSKDADHTHAFTVDNAGNGIAHQACHPTYTDVCHDHPIINGVVQPAASELAPMHTHKIK